MIKAIQMMAGTSPGSLSNRLKPHGNYGGLSFFSISRAVPPYPTSRSTFSVFPCSPSRKTHRFRPFRMSSSRSDPHPDVASSSSSDDSSTAARNFGNARKINFCQWCGGQTKHEIPDGEEKTRAICTLCGKIAYQNPKMVVGCLIEHENKILLCKRNIQPSYGLWTLPAGYMEIGESAAEGAMRETQEEAGAEVDKPHFSPGPESIECRLFDLDEIPFDSLAFSSMLVTLKLESL
ncbi:hypothetical protein V2J09_015930 [Rumex salicifolius]